MAYEGETTKLYTGNVTKVRGYDADKHEERRVRDMDVGETAWVYPWAYDKQRGRIDTEASISSNKFGTSELQVRRVSLTGWEVDFSWVKSVRY